MKICPICEVRQAGEQYMSVLGTTPICDECFHHQAERPETIHEALRVHRASPSAEAILKELLKGATIFVNHDEGYLPLRDYERRMTKQQLVVIEEEVDLGHPLMEDIILASVTQKILDITDEFYFMQSFPRQKQRRPGFRGWLAFQLGIRWGEVDA